MRHQHSQLTETSAFAYIASSEVVGGMGKWRWTLRAFRAHSGAHCRNKNRSSAGTTGEVSQKGSTPVGRDLERGNDDEQRLLVTLGMQKLNYIASPTGAGVACS